MTFTYRKDGRGKPIEAEKVRQKGRPKMIWLKKHKLHPDSHPLDWVRALLTKRLATNNSAKKTIFSQWTSWTNTKGILANSGVVGGLYPN